MTLALVLATAAGTTLAQTRRKPQADTAITNLQARMEQLTTELGGLRAQLAIAQQQPQQTGQTAAEGKIADLNDKLAGHDERLAVTESDLAGLKKLKVSGYIQARYEYLDYDPFVERATTTDKLGVKSTSTPGSQGQSVFYVRRGRFKLTYTPGPLSQYVITIDGAKDKVTCKDLYVVLTEPWTGLGISLTTGQFNWPWGIEVERSSSSREVPERSLATRSLFPGERDRGVKLTVKPHAKVTVDLGLFNGWGVDNSTFTWQDPTKQKDVIARAKVDLGFVALTGSYYDGQYYDPATSTTSLRSSVPASGSMTSTTTTTDKRRYKGRIGGGVEAYYQFLPLGGTALLAEGVMGKEKGKDVEGGYLMLVQNVGDRLNLAFRGDMYNSDVKGGEYNHTWTLTPAINYWWDDAVRLTVAYDLTHTNMDAQMKHSNPANPAGAVLDPRDNKLTCQVQIKF
jgi:hypothetical protein